MDDSGTLDAIGREISPTADHPDSWAQFHPSLLKDVAINWVAAFVEETGRRIAQTSARLGERVTLDASVLDRGDSVSLAAPGQWSANRSCRMIKARDGWIAANLPREEDLLSIPALLAAMPVGDPWEMLIDSSRAPNC
jgi:hypothetical protein